LDVVVPGERVDHDLDVEGPLAARTALIPDQKVSGGCPPSGMRDGFHVLDSARRLPAPRVPSVQGSGVLGPEIGQACQSAGGSSPTRPSTASRSRSACPVCRPYSSTRSKTSRRRLAWRPSGAETWMSW